MWNFLIYGKVNNNCECKILSQNRWWNVARITKTYSSPINWLADSTKSIHLFYRSMTDPLQGDEGTHSLDVRKSRPIDFAYLER